MPKELGRFVMLGVEYRITEHKRLRMKRKGKVDGYIIFARARIKLRRGRQPWTDLHELIHAAADATSVKLGEHKTDHLARALWSIGVKAPWQA